jgi:hypothetical protein
LVDQVVFEPQMVGAGQRCSGGLSQICLEGLADADLSSGEVLGDQVIDQLADAKQFVAHPHEQAEVLLGFALAYLCLRFLVF